jgi:hypothetical protein
MPFVVLALGIVGIVAFVTYAAVLTYTATIFVGGAGVGGILVLLYVYGEWQKHEQYKTQQRAWEREQDHRRTLEIIKAVKSGQIDEVIRLEGRGQEQQRIERK